MYPSWICSIKMYSEHTASFWATGCTDPCSLAMRQFTSNNKGASPHPRLDLPGYLNVMLSVPGSSGWSILRTSVGARAQSGLVVSCSHWVLIMFLAVSEALAVAIFLRTPRQQIYDKRKQ